MARKGTKTGRKAKAKSGGDQTAETDALNPAPGQIGDNAAAPDFPPTSPDSGKRSAMVHRQRTDRETVREARRRDDPIEDRRALASHPLGHPNRTIVEDSVADHHAPANRPFGSQPQNLDPETGNILPMGREERRTGEPDEELDEAEAAA